MSVTLFKFYAALPPHKTNEQSPTSHYGLDAKPAQFVVYPAQYRMALLGMVAAAVVFQTCCVTAPMHSCGLFAFQTERYLLSLTLAGFFGDGKRAAKIFSFVYNLLRLVLS
jgi:hypothetical protein